MQQIYNRDIKDVCTDKECADCGHSILSILPGVAYRDLLLSSGQDFFDILVSSVGGKAGVDFRYIYN